MKRPFKKTSFPYLSLQGRTVAVRVLKKIGKNKWDCMDCERSYDVVYVDALSYNSFVTPENKEYSFADIIRVF